MNDPVPGQYLYYYLNQNFYFYYISGWALDPESNRDRFGKGLKSRIPL